MVVEKSSSEAKILNIFLFKTDDTMTEKFNEIINLMKSLGLTEYESKAYIFLIIHGSLTADSLCELSGIPSGRIYDVLLSLERKGLISTIPSKPKMYLATHPSLGLDILVRLKEERLRDEIRMLKRRAKKVKNILKEIYRVSERKERPFSLGVIKGAEGLSELTKSLLKSVKKEALIFAGDLTWLETNLPLLRMMKKKNIDVKILADILPENKPLVEKASSFGVEIKQKPKDLDLRGFVLDKRILYVSKKYKVTGWEKLKNFGLKKGPSEDYWGLVTEHRPLVNVLRDYFYQIWNNA